MKEAEIKVPKELSDVIARALQVTQVQNYLERADAIAKDVLSWQREHPPVPTDEQAAEILNKAYADTAGSKAQFQWAAREWIRRMYDAPDPPFDPSLGGCLTGRTFTQKEADLIKEYIQRSVPLGMVR